MFTLLTVLAALAFALALSQPKGEPWPLPTDDEEPAGTTKGSES